MPRTGNNEAVSGYGQAGAPTKTFSTGSWHEPVLEFLSKLIFSPTSPRERQYERFISRECRDNDEEAQCSPAR